MKWLTALKLIKNYKSWIIGVIVIAAFAIGYIAAKFLPHDSPIEQASEQIIDRLTGIDLDFTPDN